MQLGTHNAPDNTSWGTVGKTLFFALLLAFLVLAGIRSVQVHDALAQEMPQAQQPAAQMPAVDMQPVAQIQFEPQVATSPSLVHPKTGYVYRTTGNYLAIIEWDNGEQSNVDMYSSQFELVEPIWLSIDTTNGHSAIYWLMYDMPHQVDKGKPIQGVFSAEVGRPGYDTTILYVDGTSEVMQTSIFTDDPQPSFAGSVLTYYQRTRQDFAIFGVAQ